MNIRISTKGKRPLRSLTPSDKVHAIQRIHDGESKASVARDIGVPESTLRGWCKNEDKLRFMSRQAAAEKLGGDSLSDKLDGGSNILGGPPEKRQRMDTSMALNFSNKIKFDELNAYKRTPINGLDFSTSKALTELGNFNSLAPDYAAFNGSAKTKLYGADISRPTDSSMAAISPLSSLTHLSGLTGLTQSPLAISFNELTTNLTILAQLNPGLAAMSGLNGLTASGSSLRNNTSKPKSQPQISSPRSDATERQTGLTVKNWAKQNPSTPTLNDSTSCGLNLCQKEANIEMKSPSTPLITHSQIGAALPPLSTLPEDPLLYWLKSQQNILGLNNMYPHGPALGAPSPPIRSSTPQQQQQNQHAGTPPIIPNTLTPSSTPSGSLDDKNAAWFNWCKAFGASLNSLAPAAVVSALQGGVVHHTSQSSGNSREADKQVSAKSSLSAEPANSEITQNANMINRPEDLSAKTSKAKSPLSSPLPTPTISPIRVENQRPSSNSSSTPTPVSETHDVIVSDQLHVSRNSVADCRDVLDNLLYKINNNPNAPSQVSDSDAIFINEQQNAVYCLHNNNNNSNKPDEEEWTKCADMNYDEEMDADSREAIQHGEKFLRWLENCSNPRVTAVQVMQLRFLISSIKEVAEPTAKHADATTPSNHLSTIEIDDSSEEGNRFKSRRRK